jgi:hypothetical protein
MTVILADSARPPPVRTGLADRIWEVCESGTTGAGGGYALRETEVALLSPLTMNRYS